LISVDKKQPQNQNMKSEASYESKGFGFKARNYRHQEGVKQAWGEK
tara:strand:+ start:423 stop:560 length:138 start_codon:yes stop_codon:yes gene_type:complete